MAYSGINSEDRLVQAAFADHLVVALRELKITGLMRGKIEV